jgi:hypothetical protein
MVEFDSAIEDMARAHPGLFIPAVTDAASRLQESFPNLPSEIFRLYELVGGSSFQDFSLMTVNEIFEFYDSSQDELGQDLFGEFLNPAHSFPVLSDMSGNYGALYTAMPLRGRCFVCDHDEPLMKPLFKDLVSMLSALLKEEARLRNGTIVGDYPAVDVDYHRPDDKDVSQAYLQMFAIEPRTETLLVAMQLSSQSDTQKFIEFLENENPHVQEAVCSLIQRRRYVPGIPRMVEAAIKTNHNNPRIAAIAALRDWDAPEVKFGIAELKRHLPASFGSYY